MVKNSTLVHLPEGRPWSWCPRSERGECICVSSTLSQRVSKHPLTQESPTLKLTSSVKQLWKTVYVWCISLLPLALLQRICPVYFLPEISIHPVSVSPWLWNQWTDGEISQLPTSAFDGHKTAREKLADNTPLRGQQATRLYFLQPAFIVRCGFCQVLSLRDQAVPLSFLPPFLRPSSGCQYRSRDALTPEWIPLIRPNKHAPGLRLVQQCCPPDPKLAPTLVDSFTPRWVKVHKRQ